ncbi:PQQ-dependent sugar dehydrogenase [Amycolatopsis sp. cg5]|uniref:PQQ-dependent sugar dehydrogenase n=1 Tax=Amycolatopsis sp. cg5 TaxID=3238802 RepID=UPI0035242139
MQRRIRMLAVLASAATIMATAAVANAADPLLSQGKPVTASTQSGCCTAAAAVDGDSATRWASTGGVDPSWIYVDLGASVHVSRVRLQWDKSCATAYEIGVSNDKTTWTKIYSTTTGKGGVEDLTTLNGDGRYVRMLGTKRCRTDAAYGYSLQEFGVYGTNGGGGDTVAPTPPGKPELVSATPSSATIKWGAATDNVAVTAYDIFRDGQLCASTAGNVLQGTCNNLNPNVTYGFYVNARDAAGNVSQASETTPVKTPPSNDTQKPTVPTNVKSSNVQSTSVGLSWTASTDNVGVTGYNVFNVSGGTSTKVGSTNGTSITVGGLTPNTAYHLQVTAFDANGNESAGSTPLVDVTTSGGSSCTPSQGMCTVKQVGTDDDVVWGLVTLPDGTILYNQRDAHTIVHMNPATGSKKTIGTVPNVQSTSGEGGLTGLEINPKSFSSDNWLYIMHTSPNDNRIVRIKYDPAADSLLTSTEQVLVSGIQRNKFHDGGRLRFSPDGKYLFAGTGDAQNGDNAQNKSNLNGKVLRINPDGTIPSDNPFGNAIWTLGHRNIQGLAFDSQGRLWEQEFGNSIMDETNLIEKGGNYGWPKCEGTSGSCGGFIAPKKTYPVGSGSCSGITIVHDALYVACQKGERIYRHEISGSSLVNSKQFFSGTYGRLRTVEPAPNGGIWMATSNGGDKDSTPHNSNNKIFHVTVA